MGGGPFFLNYDPAAGEPPPQAPAPTPTPNPLGDLAMGAGAPLPSPVADLRRSAFGDEGAANYDALVAAGQRRPMAGIAGIAGVPVAPGPSAIGPLGAETGGALGDIMSLFGDVAMGAAGMDPTKMRGRREAEAAQQQLMMQRDQTMRIQQEQFTQQQAIQDQAFYKSLKDFAPQYRPGFVSEYFGKQGRQVSPQMAQVLSDQQVLTEMNDPAVQARLASDPAFKNMYIHAYEKPEQMATFRDVMRKTIAEADKAVDDATTAHAKATYALPNEILNFVDKINKVGRTPTDNEQRTMNSAGMELVYMPIAGLRDPNGGQVYQWKPVPIGGGALPGAAPGGAAPTGAPRVKAVDFLYPQGVPGATTAPPAAGAPPAPGATAPPTAGAPAPTGAPPRGPTPTGKPAGPLPPGAVARIDPARALKSDQPRNIRENTLREAAIATLDKRKAAGEIESYDEADISNEVERRRAWSKGLESEASKTASKVVEQRLAASEGLAQLDSVREAVDRIGLARNTGERALQPFRFLKLQLEGDPDYDVVRKDFDAIMDKLARSIGGQRGVLTDTDIRRMRRALGVGYVDTQDMYDARVNFVETSMLRALAAIEKAAKEQRDPERVSLDDLTYGEGDTDAKRGAKVPSPVQRGQSTQEAAP